MVQILNRSVMLLSLIACVLSLHPSTAHGSSPTPNVVLILADDLGWSDTTLYGTTKLYRTPNIERLARRGMTFTRAYSSSPLCSPTRASVLTGMSPPRTGITTPGCHLPRVIMKATEGRNAPAKSPSISPVSANRLDTNFTTLSELLGDAGYATGHFGKWHLGPEPYSPLEHGFDIDVPHWPGPGPAGSYVAPWKFPDFDPQTPDEHIEDRMASEAVEFMEENRDRPFFLNYWMFSVHAPFDAKSNLIAKYRSRVRPNDPQRSPTYAAMVESMDDAVGTLLDTLDRLGIADNTIIVFGSDNGGNMYNEVDGTTPTSNLPLRGGKATMYEGGIRVPLIVAWPGKTRGGTRSDVLTNSCDFLPTILEMLGIETPDKRTLDGVSIVPALSGKPIRREAIFTYFPHNPPVPDWMPPAVSVHRGDWKLIRLFHAGENGQHRWKLFNLSNDIGETNDLAIMRPDIVRELDGLIDDFLSETNAVLAIRNPSFDPAEYRIEDEGKPASRHAHGKKKTAKRIGKSVAGWTPSGDCTLSIDGQTLLIRSTGRDPYSSYQFPRALDAGEFVLELEMSSDAKGHGQVYWQESGVDPRFSADRSVRFDVQPDGGPHRYQIRFETANKTVGIRLDPARAVGEIRISNMRLTNANGKVLKNWTFAP